ncbi:ABC transporter permease subunit [Streptomyces sp. NPDC046831]|uniref:ABC transporter permease subunit n=1 Tax=Streptomyces sp. NPDC046831 TaxID=3154805 RepID=UPI0033D902F1
MWRPTCAPVTARTRSLSAREVRRKLTLLPTVLVVVLLATSSWLRLAPLDAVSRRAFAHGRASVALWQHIGLAVGGTVLALVVAVPLGAVLTRGALRRSARVPEAVAAAHLAAALLGLLVLLVFRLGGDTWVVAAVVTVCAALPLLSRAVTGLRGVDPALLTRARAAGVSPSAILVRAELPAALPLVLAGVRGSLVMSVGAATVAGFAGGGGLGALIAAGVSARRMPVLALGTVLSVCLALMLDWLASLPLLLGWLPGSPARRHRDARGRRRRATTAGT